MILIKILLNKFIFWINTIKNNIQQVLTVLMRQSWARMQFDVNVQMAMKEMDMDQMVASKACSVTKASQNSSFKSRQYQIQTKFSPNIVLFAMKIERISI